MQFPLKDFQQGRLARTISPQQADPFARLNLQAHIVEDVCPAVTETDIP
jgi:hypothetical protein